MDKKEKIPIINPIHLSLFPHQIEKTRAKSPNETTTSVLYEKTGIKPSPKQIISPLSITFKKTGLVLENSNSPKRIPIPMMIFVCVNLSTYQIYLLMHSLCI